MKVISLVSLVLRRGNINRSNLYKNIVFLRKTHLRNKIKALKTSNVSVINVNDQKDDTERLFKYSLNDKRAKSNLLKGAQRTQHLETEFKSGCVNVRFSDGAYHEIVLPLLKTWLQNCNKEFVINGSTLRIIEAEEGKDVSARHVDTKIVMMFDNEKVVIHAYNTTQNVSVQGRKREPFVQNILEPFLLTMIHSATDRIEKLNE